MMHVNDVHLIEFEMQTLLDRNKTQVRTIDGLTIEDMLVSQRQPSFIRWLRNSIRQRRHGQQAQRQVTHQPTVALSAE